MCVYILGVETLVSFLRQLSGATGTQLQAGCWSRLPWKRPDGISMGNTLLNAQPPEDMGKAGTLGTGFAKGKKR